jgi:SAM-dependent methyltransferase
MQVDQSKRHRWQWRFTYLLKSALTTTIGPSRTLKMLLRFHWILRRISFEVSGAVFGDRFQNSALGLSDELLLSLIEPGDRVADLGCGTGRWSRVSARKADRVFGIDANPHTLEQAKLLGGGINYMPLDLDTRLDEIPNVDLTLMIHFLEHIENPLALLNGLRKKSGKIVIEVPDFESDPLNYARLWKNEPFYFDSDHLREFTIHELQILLRETGWTPIFVAQKGGTILIVAT